MIQKGVRIVAEQDKTLEEAAKAETKAAADEANDEAIENAGEEEQETVEETAAEGAEPPAGQEAVKEGKEKKNLFKKKEKKDKKDELIEELNDKVKRQMAEFDNFRKRTEKEKSAMYEVGARSVVEKILPVVDNFERGLQTVPEEQKNDAFVEGMDKIYKQLLTSLEEIGVKPIEALGAQFDPDFHNAVMHVDDEACGENEIVEEFQKGYMYRETVVRHSMVKVAN